MYILEAEISNLRSLRALSWSVSHEEAAGWHVILGDNGAGKSSLLKAIALALVGPENAKALRLQWENWVRKGESRSEVKLRVEWDEEFDKVIRSWSIPLLKMKKENQINFFIQEVEEADNDSDAPLFQVSGETPLSARKRGGFSAAYGPFRRFSGGDKEYESLVRSYSRLARHLSIFDERVALTECLEWLRQLRFQQLESESSSEGVLLDQLKEFINQEDFLPFGTRLHEISSKEVTFIDGNGCQVKAEEMSDGYRSMLSMTFELIRQLAREYGPERLFTSDDPTKIAVPGIVLIDEVDAHLHRPGSGEWGSGSGGTFPGSSSSSRRIARWFVRRRRSGRSSVCLLPVAPKSPRWLPAKNWTASSTETFWMPTAPVSSARALHVR